MLTILTFNLLQLPVLSYADRGLRRIELARRAVQRLDPDVVVLNEAFSLSPSGYLVRSLRSHGYDATPQLSSFGAEWTSSTGPRVLGRSLLGGGVRVLSRRGLHERHQLVFSSYHGGTADSLVGKGCLLVRIDGPLWIAATHLQADQPKTPVEQTGAVRLEQLAEIRALVRSLVPPADPVLLVGDLNVEHGTEHATAAAAAVGGMLEPAGRMHEPTFDGTTNPLTGRDFPGYRHVLDYVCCLDEHGSRPVPRIRTETIRYAAGEEASDHYPVLAEVSF